MMCEARLDKIIWVIDHFLEAGHTVMKQVESLKTNQIAKIVLIYMSREE